jgi:hypothetical protein
MPVIWKLSEFLEANSITPYSLAKESGVSKNNTYGVVNTPPKLLHVGNLGEYIQALRTLTGKPVAVSDLLEYQEPATAALEPAATHARDQSDRQGTAGTESENGPAGQPQGSTASNGIDPESRAWLDADLSRLAELGPYPWAEGEAEEGLPVRYIEGQGFVIGDKQ